MSTDSETSAKAAWAWGGAFLASVMLIMAGAWQMLEGIAAINTDDVVNTKPHFVFQFSLQSWGWIHLIIGLLCVITGFALFKGGEMWRKIAVVIIAVSMFTNFAWIPYYPFWALTIIALELLIIFALLRYTDPGTGEASTAFGSDSDVVSGPGVTMGTQTQVPR